MERDDANEPPHAEARIDLPRDPLRSRMVLASICFAILGITTVVFLRFEKLFHSEALAPTVAGFAASWHLLVYSVFARECVVISGDRIERSRRLGRRRLPLTARACTINDIVGLHVVYAPARRRKNGVRRQAGELVARLASGDTLALCVRPNGAELEPVARRLCELLEERRTVFAGVRRDTIVLRPAWLGEGVFDPPPGSRVSVEWRPERTRVLVEAPGYARIGGVIGAVGIISLALLGFGVALLLWGPRNSPDAPVVGMTLCALGLAVFLPTLIRCLHFFGCRCEISIENGVVAIERRSRLRCSRATFRVADAASIRAAQTDTATRAEVQFRLKDGTKRVCAAHASDADAAYLAYFMRRVLSVPEHTGELAEPRRGMVARESVPLSPSIPRHEPHVKRTRSARHAVRHRR